MKLLERKGGVVAVVGSGKTKKFAADYRISLAGSWESRIICLFSLWLVRTFDVGFGKHQYKPQEPWGMGMSLPRWGLTFFGPYAFSGLFGMVLAERDAVLMILVVLLQGERKSEEWCPAFERDSIKDDKRLISQRDPLSAANRGNCA